jgi:hypothetical protein
MHACAKALAPPRMSAVRTLPHALVGMQEELAQVQAWQKARVMVKARMSLMKNTMGRFSLPRNTVLLCRTSAIDQDLALAIEQELTLAIDQGALCGTHAAAVTHARHNRLAGACLCSTSALPPRVSGAPSRPPGTPAASQAAGSAATSQPGVCWRMCRTSPATARDWDLDTQNPWDRSSCQYSCIQRGQGPTQHRRGLETATGRNRKGLGGRGAA